MRLDVSIHHQMIEVTITITTTITTTITITISHTISHTISEICSGSFNKQEMDLFLNEF